MKFVPCWQEFRWGKTNTSCRVITCNAEHLCPHCQEIAALRRKVTVTEMERDHARVRWDEACEGAGATPVEKNWAELMLDEARNLDQKGSVGRPVDTEAAKEYKAWATYPLT